MGEEMECERADRKRERRLSERERMQNEIHNLTKELGAYKDDIKTLMTENQLKLRDEKTNKQTNPRSFCFFLLFFSEACRHFPALLDWEWG